MACVEAGASAAPTAASAATPAAAPAAAPGMAMAQDPARGAEAEARSPGVLAPAQDAARRDAAGPDAAGAVRLPERPADAPAAAPQSDAEHLAPPLERPAAASPERPSALTSPPPQAAAILAAHPAPAALPAAAPPPAPHSSPPVRQLAPVVVSVAIAGGTARLSVTLEPAELGRVEISVERGAAAAEIRILAERPETLALLQRDQRELDRALGQAGIGPEERRLSFALAERGPGGHGHGQHGERRDERARGPRATASAEPPARRLLSLIDFAI